MPNDVETYRGDSFDNMKAFAVEHGFTFPYVIDETQEVARTYGAQCTSDFFGFNAQDELQYRGRLDGSRMTRVANARRDLFAAMKQVSETGQGPAEQIPSIAAGLVDGPPFDDGFAHEICRRAQIADPTRVIRKGRAGDHDQKGLASRSVQGLDHVRKL